MPNFLVIIPTYNEVLNIERILDVTMTQDKSFHVLVVDDNSSDGTPAYVQRKMVQYTDRVFLLSRPLKQGLGSAYVAGFRWALKKEYDYIVEMDADFSHPVQILSSFYSLLREDSADVVVGSRYVAGGKVVNWPCLRRLISRMGSLYTRFMTQMPLHDTTSGFVAYKREVLASINFSRLTVQGYAFQIEMKLASWKLGYRIKEIPIVFTNREYGISKMSSSIIWEAMLRVLFLSFFLLIGRYRCYIQS